MLRKKMPKELTKLPEGNKEVQSKPATTAKPPAPQPLPAAKIETKAIVIEKDKFNKDRIAEMVANNRISNTSPIQSRPKNRMKSSIK